MRVDSGSGVFGPRWKSRPFALIPSASSAQHWTDEHGALCQRPAYRSSNVIPAPNGDRSDRLTSFPWKPATLRTRSGGWKKPWKAKAPTPSSPPNCAFSRLKNQARLEMQMWFSGVLMRDSRASRAATPPPPATA